MKLPDVASARPADLAEVVERELKTQHRLLPHRQDYATLLGHVDDVVHLIKNGAKSETAPALGDVVYAQKGWRGSRPLTVMGLPDAVAFRYLCERIAPRLPAHVRKRMPSASFKRALLEEEGITHIAVTDVTAYYEFVDHGLLADELVAQTGEAPVIDQLLRLTAGVMGRGVGLPQIHSSSDILGDAYIDRVRRRLRRRGYKTVTFSDDFRIGAANLSDARRVLEACATEMRHLGLVMNERKTFTYTVEKYEHDLDAFSEAERDLFAGADVLARFWVDKYDGDEQLQPIPTSLAAEPLTGGEDEGDVTSTMADNPLPTIENSEPLMEAAERALLKWVAENRGDEDQTRTQAAITQSLLGRALPILGDGDSHAAFEHAPTILRRDPSLTPQLASYLIRYSQRNVEQRTEVRDLLDQIVDSSILSDWQAIWITYVASYLRSSSTERTHVQWLERAVRFAPDAVAASAAAALGNIGRGDPDVLAVGVGRVGPAWRSLAVWGLARVSAETAQEVAEDGIDQLLASSTPPAKRRAVRVPRRQRS